MKRCVKSILQNKQHWNSVKADGKVPDNILMDLLDKAYTIVLAGFSKKKQKEILGNEWFMKNVDERVKRLRG